MECAIAYIESLLLRGIRLGSKSVMFVMTLYHMRDIFFGYWGYGKFFIISTNYRIPLGVTILILTTFISSYFKGGWWGGGLEEGGGIEKKVLL